MPDALYAMSVGTHVVGDVTAKAGALPRIIARAAPPATIRRRRRGERRRDLVVVVIAVSF
jgi:hypothetical protein